MVGTLNLASIKFKAGSSRGRRPLEIICPNVTVLIGPNNSGKSQALREIERDCTGADDGQPRIVTESIAIDVPSSADEIMAMLEPFNRGPPPGETAAPEHFWLRRPTIAGQSDIRAQVRTDGFARWLSAPEWRPLKQNFVRFLTLRLDGATRFGLVVNQPSGPLEQAPANHLWALFQDGQARAKVSSFAQAAFNRFFVVDPTGMVEFRMRLSKRAPKSVREEQGFDPRAQEFHQAADLVTSLGDGVKASVGLVAAVHSLPDRIILVDEPEAFLHPTLARRIGRVLAETARERCASLVVATHSAELLTGCIQATQDLRLVRLTFESGQSTARTLEPADITALMSDPLLRSANALRALFHRGVVVCEADADRAFYEEVNARLVAEGIGIDDALFMNAQNWQTVPRIVEPLRMLGVPATGIFDFDVLMDKEFSRLWCLVEASPVELAQMQQARNAAKRMLEAVGRTAAKNLGLGALAPADQPAVRQLLIQFARHGVFFVPVGELEGWLSTLGIARKNKAHWILRVFEQMGADPVAADYLRPSAGDVWMFLRGVKAWIDDPARMGIPP